MNIFYYILEGVLIVYQQIQAGISRIRNDLEQIRTIAQQLEQNERANQQALGQIAQREGYAAQKLNQIESLAGDLSQQTTQITGQPQVYRTSYQPVGQSGVTPSAQGIFNQTVPSPQQGFSQQSPHFQTSSFPSQQLQPQQQQALQSLRNVTKQQSMQQFSPSVSGVQSVQPISGQQSFSQ